MESSLNTTMTNLTLNSSLTLQTQLIIRPLYTEESFWTVRILSPSELFIILFGLISNTINLIVFYKAGVRDNVTILLFSLAMSDSAFLCFAAPNAAFWTIWVVTLKVGYRWPFDPRFIYGLFYWPAYTAFDISCFISVSLGVMRCACVAMPLKFKLVFTKSRTLKWVVFLVVLAVALRSPVLSVHRIAKRTDPLTNTTKPYVEIVNVEAMSRINNIMNRGVVIWTNYFIMVGCVCLLSFKLYQASKIRRTVTNQGSSDQGMSSKDIQVVKSVVLVCSIFVFSQFATFFLSLIRLTESTFRGQIFLYVAMTGMTGRISFTCSIINASVNIFVYYNYNSRYRAVFLSLFPTSKGEKAIEK